MEIFTLTMVPINPPHDDAAKNIVVDVARRLRGHKFMFVSSVFGRSFAREKNMKFLPSPFQKTGRHKMSRLQKVYVSFSILFNLKKIDLLQFFITPQPYFSNFFRKLLKKTGKKSIQIIPSIYTLHEKNQKKDIPGLFFADHVVVYSDFAKDKLERMGVGNITRIYPGIDIDKFDKDTSGYNKELVREAVPDNVFKVVYPGTYKVLKKSYSFDKFCAIASEVVEKIGNVNFIMACRIRTKEDIALENEFKQIAGEVGIIKNFTFLNTVEDMPSLFRECDLGIMPLESPAAGVLEIPMVILEIASVSKPVVYGNVSPLDELSNKSLGVMVSDSSPEAYAENIIELLKDEEASRFIGQNSREAVVSHFNVDNMASEYGKLYKTLER